MTREEANTLQKMIEKMKSYPYATQFDKGEPVLDRYAIGMLLIFIEGLINK